jgi:hypothetical protein
VFSEVLFILLRIPPERERRCWNTKLTSTNMHIRLTHVESTPLAAIMESTKTHVPQQGAALMKRTTKYVALDVHQATTAASVREGSGRVIARTLLPTEEGPAVAEALA